MPTPLPARPSLEWLRRRAKQQLLLLRQTRPESRLADAQLAVARAHGFSSWRSLRARVLGATKPALPEERFSDSDVALFLKRVGAGDLPGIDAMLREHPGLVHAIGPHPFWGGRPQGLHVAIETRRRPVFDRLLKAGADPNGRNDEYAHWSPLLLAIHGAQPGMRRTLLRRGAQVGLVEALALGDDRRVRALLKRGAAALPTIVPSDGSLLMLARTPFAIDALLALGVSPDLRDRWGTTPMQAFSRLGSRGRPLVRHLLGRGIAAGPEAFARLNDRRTLARLIAENPDVARDPRVLKGAVDFRHHALTAWLLDRGADPDSRGGGEADETALHSAAWNGDLRMVELLMARGANPNLLDRQYQATAAGWAETSVEVSNNPDCAAVAALLRNAESRSR